MLIQRLSVCFSLIYSLAFDCDKVFVVGQYPNDYFDSQNAISNDAYYYSNGRQYNDPEPDADIGATATLLVGGAALLGAIGIVGIASLQGLQNFHEIADKHKEKDDCCEDLEHVILKLKEDFNDEQKDQDRLESRQRCLCNLADRLSQLNVDRADPSNQAPDQNDFNGLVNKFNDLIGQLNTLPDARCCSLI